jgi:hypothetical protein
MLKSVYNQIVKVLFTKDELKKFYTNKKFNIKKKIKFKSMISYPKSKFNKIKYNKDELFEIILNIIKENHCRALHPNWIILFHQELSEVGFTFPNIITSQEKEILEFRHSKITIRKQICESFKIHTYLLSDVILKRVIGTEYYNHLILNLNIEEHISSDRINNSKYIDIIYNFDHKDWAVPIEIQESHHHVKSDITRRNQIFANTLMKLILYYVEDSDFDMIYQQIMESFAKVLINLNERIGICLYFTKINKWDIAYSEIFSKFYYCCITEKMGISIKELSNILKNDFKLNNSLNIINNMIKNKDLIKIHLMKKEKFYKKFLIEGKDNEKKIIKRVVNIDAKLNLHGINAIISYPRRNEWKESIKVKQYYSEFMIKYIDMIKMINTNNLEELNMLRESYIEARNINGMSTTLLKDLIIEWNKKIKKYRGNIKLHPVIPFLIKDENKHIQISRLQKLFGRKIVNEWKQKIETKSSIVGYRQINKNEMDEINDYISKLNIKSESESDSEIEGL